MIRWAEITGTPSKVRFDYLSQFLKSLGHENEVNYVVATDETFPDEIRQAMQKFEHIRITSPFGERVTQEIQDMEAIPAATMIQKSSDCLIFEDEHWWARSMLAEGLIREVALMKKMDISETAFIVGAGSSCRAVVSALMKAGFQKFNITERFEERGQLLIKDLKATYFGADFRFTPQSSITQLPGIHSILVNTTPLVQSNDLLNELYYCNFLKPDAVVIDLTIMPYDTPLIKAAQQVGARTVHGCDVATLVDTYWLKSSMKIEVDSEKYLEGLKKVCSETPFDFSGFEIPEF